MKTLMLLSLWIATAAAVMVAPARAGAASPDQEDANEHFARGRRDYDGGRYSDAANEYQRGYALVGEPRFLLGIARSYETLGDRPRARDYYRRFLTEAAKDDPARPDAAAALAKLDPVGHVTPPKPYLDAGRTPEEIRAALGDEEYERYVASGLTLNGFRQRDHGNRLGAEGIGVAVTSLAVGVVLILTAGTHGARAVVGYCVAGVGGPVGFYMMRIGFSASTMANFQVRPNPGTTLSMTGRGAVGSLSFAF
jgi:hypothetical protein